MNNWIETSGSPFVIVEQQYAHQWKGQENYNAICSVTDYLGKIYIDNHRDKAAAKTNTRVARNRQERVSAPKQPVSNRRLYVGNLSYEATESDLEDVFKAWDLKGNDHIRKHRAG